jgi:hypothetical protein
MTRKNDKSFSAKRTALERVQGQLNEAQKQERQHREETHSGYGSPDESLTVPETLSELRERIAAGDEAGVQRVIFDLAPTHNGRREVPDEVVEGLLTILRDPAMFASHLAGHVLNYFEFEAPRLSSRQKQLCRGFIAAHGDRFSDVLAAQVIAELREGPWLATGC